MKLSKEKVNNVIKPIVWIGLIIGLSMIWGITITQDSTSVDRNPINMILIGAPTIIGLTILVIIIKITQKWYNSLPEKVAP